MKSKFVFFLTLALMLILDACSPFVITTSSGEQPTPEVEALPATDLPATRYQPVDVYQVQVEVGVGSPIPVHVIVTGNLPDTCAQIELVQQKQVDSNFEITVSTVPSNAEGCIPDTLPFRLEIPLNIVDMPEGPYEVNVNGITASFDPRSTPAAPTNLEDLGSQVQAALMQRDAEGLRALMGERFMVAYWQSEGESIPSEEAVAQILNSHLGEHNYLVFQEFQSIPAFDPRMSVGPDVELAKAIYVYGWGLDSRGDALLFISRRPDGSLFWQGLMVTPKGFAPPLGQVCSEPVEVPVVDGRASYNGISFSIDEALNYGMAARNCPTADWDPQWMIEAHPPYTEFFLQTYSRQNVDFQPLIRVYDVTGDLQNYPYPLGAPDELQATLEQRPKPITWFDGAPLHTREAYLDFANGTGVRGLVQRLQDIFFYSNNGLIYEFQGLTQDGRYFVEVRYPVSVPFLMELEGFSLPPNNINPSAIPISEWPSSYEQQRQVIEAYNKEALQRFEQMSENEAFPDLALLDQLVRAIEVSQP